MPTLPASRASLLVRTDFGSDADWAQLCELAQAVNEYDFSADLQPVSDPAFDGADWLAVREALPSYEHAPSVLFIADRLALNDADHPVLVVGLRSNLDRPPLRCIPAELWSIENNLNLSNMHWNEFAGATDAAGVFRGFA